MTATQLVALAEKRHGIKAAFQVADFRQTDQ